MSNAYSVDLRERVITFLLKGGATSTACKLFQIGEATVYRWLRQHRHLGHVIPKVRGKTTPRKLEDTELRAYVAAHPDATLAEMGAHFAVSAVAVWKACQRLAITRKKPSSTASATTRLAWSFKKNLTGLTQKAWCTWMKVGSMRLSTVRMAERLAAPK